MEKSEIPTKLISFGNSNLSVLTSLNKHSFIRLFIKTKDFLDINDSFEQIDSNENYNYDNQSAGALNDYYDYLEEKQIEKDKKFYSFTERNNINVDKAFFAQYLKLIIIIMKIKLNINL